MSSIILANTKLHWDTEKRNSSYNCMYFVKFKSSYISLEVSFVICMLRYQVDVKLFLKLLNVKEF